MNQKTLVTSKTIDIHEGIGDLSRWIRNEDIEEVKVPIYKEMGGEFSRIQQCRWYKQAITDLIQTGAKLEIFVRNNEEKLWARDQIMSLLPEE